MATRAERKRAARVAADAAVSENPEASVDLAQKLSDATADLEAARRNLSAHKQHLEYGAVIIQVALNALAKNDARAAVVALRGMLAMAWKTSRDYAAARRAALDKAIGALRAENTPGAMSALAEIRLIAPEAFEADATPAELAATKPGNA